VLMMPVGCLPRNSRWLTSHVSPTSLAAVAIVLLMIAGAAGLAVLRACRPDRLESRAVWLWGVSVFLLVLGAKLCLIRDYGSSVPFLVLWFAGDGSWS